MMIVNDVLHYFLNFLKLPRLETLNSLSSFSRSTLSSLSSLTLFSLTSRHSLCSLWLLDTRCLLPHLHKIRRSYTHTPNRNQTLGVLNARSGELAQA